MLTLDDFGFLSPEAKRKKELQYHKDRWARIKDQRNAERRANYAANREELVKKQQEYRRKKKERAA